MLNKTYSATIQKAFKSIDWKLLIFLILFLNVKLVIKLAAIVLIYLSQFNFKFGLSFHNPRLPLFYPIMIAIGIFNWFIGAGFTSLNYTAVFVIGSGFWIISFLAIHQVKLAVERNTPAVTEQTIVTFFIINALVSLSVYLLIVFQIGAVNPYLYQGDYQKYFMSTGDYVKGIPIDTSTTNAVLNAFGVIYFLAKKNAKMMILCMVILLMTCSNITNLLLGAVLIFMFIFQSDRDQKSLVFVCLLLLVIFLEKVSPQNNRYVSNFIQNIFKPNEKKHGDKILLSIGQRPDSTLTSEERDEKTAIRYLDSVYNVHYANQRKLHARPASFIEKSEIPAADINSAPFQHKSIITPVEEKMIQFIHSDSTDLKMSNNSVYSSNLPGKILAWEQTIHFFKDHPFKFITGTGIGNFSSKLAFKTTGLNMAGSYWQKYRYINVFFLKNHLDLYLHYFTKKDDFHSVVNNPNSVYDQLVSEYGLLGLISFFIFYLGFFLKQFLRLTYGIPLILFLSGIFFVDYWFEQLSIVVFFELLLFLNIREGKNEY